MTTLKDHVQPDCLVPERTAMGFMDLAVRRTTPAASRSRIANQTSAEVLAVNVYELIRNAVLLAKVHNNNDPEDTTVTLGLHYSGKWIVSKTLVVDVLPYALQNALRYAETIIHITTRMERQGVSAYQRAPILVVEINDDGPDYVRQTADSAVAATSMGKESVVVKRGGILNGPLLQIRVPLDLSIAVHEVPELALTMLHLS